MSRAGNDLQSKGLQQVAANNQQWLEQMRKYARRLAVRRGVVCTDDLRGYAEQLQKRGVVPSHPNAWGALFRTKEFICVGYIASRYPQNHARRIGLWSLMR